MSRDKLADLRRTGAKKSLDCAREIVYEFCSHCE